MVVAISFLLLLTLGATYAFFQISVKNNTTEANINLHTGELNNVALSQGVKSLHIKLSAEDMSSRNTGDYYAVTDGTNYSRSMNTVTIASIETEGTMKDTCTGDIVVSISEGMADVLEEGDAILYIKGGNIEKTIDLTEIKSEVTKSKTYTAYFDIDTATDTTQNIQAWLKIVNKSDSSQNYLAGLTLNLTININNFKCGVEKAKGEDPLTVMRRTDENKTLGGEDQATAVDGLLRYKGTYEEVLNNYICFGTDDEKTCTSDKDTYMYRIIGITSGLSEAQTNLGLQEGQLKLIKAVPPLNLPDTNGCTYWPLSSPSALPCDGLNITWGGYDGWEDDPPNSSTRVYLNSDYLGTIESSWQNIIISQKWFTGENGKQDGRSCSFEVNWSKEVDNSMTEKDYQIGLMYGSDYYNSWDYNEANPNTNSWLHITHGLIDSQEKYSEIFYESTLSYLGQLPSPCTGSYHTSIDEDGYLGKSDTTNEETVRPSFYLSPSILITGEGTETHPFIITNVE